MLNKSNVRYISRQETATEDHRPGKRGLVRVILVSNTPKCLSHILRYFEMQDCWYGVASTYGEARDIIQLYGCDLLMGLAPRPQGIVASLASTMSDRHASFFCAQPVEEGCWWLPVYLRGELCFGSPALRPNEFATLLDELVDEIRHAQAEIESSRQLATALTLAAG